MTLAISALIASCDSDDSVAVSGVTLDSTNLSLAPGDSATLVATVSPDNADDKSVTWKSSDTDVATVDVSAGVGVVASKSVGTATITVTTTDGGKTAKCTVTVSEAEEEESAADEEDESAADEEGSSGEDDDGEGEGSESQVIGKPEMA